MLSRAAAFQRGEWTQLIRSARPSRQRSSAHTQELPPDEVSERKRHHACATVRQGELSRARQVLTAAELASGTEATWRALTDPERRARPYRPNFWHTNPSARSGLQPDRYTALREAKRGGAVGLLGMQAEHLKLLLQDAEAIELLADAATLLARAHIPPEIQTALAMARFNGFVQA